jgi:copper homeostasis protein (lipoprotein)
MNPRTGLIPLLAAVLTGCGLAASEPVITDNSPASDTAESVEPSSDRHRTGRFTYMADAAMFEDCSNGKRFPVAMEGGYLELERAYLNSRDEPGKPVVVVVEGRFLERPSMEGNRNIVNLIVDSFIAVSDEKSCISSFDEPLRNTYWKLIELNGKAVNTHEGRREAHMILAASEDQLRGHGGCNRFSGGFTLDDETISFGAMVMTEMGCVEGNDTELAFMNALSHTDRYAIGGQVLRLYQGDTLLATFEAVHLN